MRSLKLAGAALLAGIMAACVPRAVPPASAPTPPARPTLPPPPAPPQPVPPPMNWMDAPLSPGDWRYRQEGETRLAVFQSDTVSLTLRCDASGGSVGLIVTGSQAPALYINTSYGDRRLAALPVNATRTSVALAATDPLLDQIAFSRGRFLVQAEGGIRLILPAWPEIARVTEDCRGQ